MGKKEVKLPDPPSKAYLISFGDTMTALLAFFIVLNSLATEQTGANLHAGTGSFVQAFAGKSGSGAPGNGTVSQGFQMPEAKPTYVIPAEGDEESTGMPTGTDDTDQHERVLNRQEEDFQRFIQEIKRLHTAEELPKINGEVTFDVFGVLPSQPPFMNAEFRQIIIDSAPAVRRPGHALQLIVWARMPSESAWRRAIQQAEGLRKEVRELLGPAADRFPIEATGQPWISQSARRPGASVVIQRTTESY